MSDIQITNGLCFQILIDLREKYPEIKKEIDKIQNDFHLLPPYLKEIIIIHAENKEKKYLELSNDKHQMISTLCIKHNIGNINNQIFVNEVHNILNK